MTEIARPKTALTLKDHLNSDAMRQQIARALPKHMTADRMLRVATTSLLRTPKLAQCDQASFFRCLLELSQYGLEPDGRHAHLIPFGKECTLIIDYKGLVQLMHRSGTLKRIHADVVREGDLFTYSAGDIREHVPHAFRRDAGRPAAAGDVFAAYCMAELMTGGVVAVVMSVDEIEAIRKRSKSGSNGPWVTDWNEMAKKTCCRRLSKWIPLSSEIAGAFDTGDDLKPQGPPTIVEAMSMNIGEPEPPADEPTLEPPTATEPAALPMFGEREGILRGVKTLAALADQRRAWLEIASPEDAHDIESQCDDRKAEIKAAPAKA